MKDFLFQYGSYIIAIISTLIAISSLYVLKKNNDIQKEALMLNKRSLHVKGTAFPASAVPSFNDQSGYVFVEALFIFITK